MQIVIIGNGITGITAARHIRKLSDHAITVISAESPFFFSRTALMYVYMGHMKFEHTKPYEDWFWKKNRIGLVHDYVENIDFDQKVCWLRSGKHISYDKLVLATGAKPNTLGINFKQVHGAQGLYSLQDLESMEKNTRDIGRAVIIGGGLIGVEMAEMLHSRGIHTTMLVMEKSYWNNALPWEESQMITRHIGRHGIELKLETQLYKILQDASGRVRAVITDRDEEIQCSFLGITVGVSPSIDFIRNSAVDTGRGILVNEFLETSDPDVYAGGDCAEFRNPAPGQFRVEQLWYTGRMQGQAIARNICGERKPYVRGIWFNSAKFFNLEYQTYGTVPVELPGTSESFFWEHTGQEKCLRIVWDGLTRQVTGFNALGLRLRHEVCEAWIRQGKTVEEVMEHLEKANFDPEFFRRYERDIRASFYHEKPIK